MKKTDTYKLLVILFFIPATQLKAQILLDSVIVQCMYTMKWKPDSTQEKYNNDLLVLEMGRHASKCYSHYNYLRDSTRHAQLERGASIYEVQENTRLMRRGVSYAMAKQHRINELMVSDKIVFENFMYTESVPKINWQIRADTCTILSYACHKAVATFRGRTWEAWFSTNIPLQEGPWQFSGLPGLILKLADTRQNYIIECFELEQLHSPRAMLFYIESVDEKAYTKVSREQYLKNMRLFHKDFYEYLRINLGTSVQDSDGKQSKSTKPKTYNPIELK